MTMTRTSAGEREDIDGDRAGCFRLTPASSTGSTRKALRRGRRRAAMSKTQSALGVSGRREMIPRWRILGGGGGSALRADAFRIDAAPERIVPGPARQQHDPMGSVGEAVAGAGDGFERTGLGVIERGRELRNAPGLGPLQQRDLGQAERSGQRNGYPRCRDAQKETVAVGGKRA